MTEQSGGGDDVVVDTPLEASKAPLVEKGEGEDVMPLDSDEMFGDNVEEDGEELDDAREGETPEEALQRRIEEGNIGKGKTLRRWKDTEEKQRMVESGRHDSKVQRYGQIYEEVRALRKETRHSVQDLRERFKEKGVIQNKDQFIVRLIAQERNEQEGKVAAIKSLQQWRLTDVELHNFINRCHKKGLAGKLDLASQWAFEQEEAGGEVNFKEGLAFYSSIGILQPRSSAHTQQQWREWREWEDAMTSAIEKRKSGDGERPAGEEGAEPAAADASCNEDSTVCNSPWSSERGGGGGSFGGFNGSLRACSAHGEGDVAGGYGSSRFRSRSGTAPESSKDATTRLLPRRGRTPANRDSPSRQKRGWWSWRSYSPPSSTARQKSADLGKAAREKKAASEGSSGVAGGGAAADGGNGSGRPLASPARLDPPEGGSGGKLGESVVRAGGGYLPPRHPLAALQLSPTRSLVGGGGGVGEVDLGAESGGSSGGEGESPTLGSVPNRRGPMARGAARTRAKGPAGDGTGLRKAATAAAAAEAAGEVAAKSTPTPAPSYEDDAPTEEGMPSGRRTGGGRGGRKIVQADGLGGERQASLSGVLSGLADWLMPGMDGQNHARNREARVESGDDVYVLPGTPPKRGTKSAPVTPRGRRPASSVLRDGGWFYNGDSDYSTEEESGGFESEDEGFWGDAGTTEPPRMIGGGGGVGILERLKRLFT